MQIVSAVAFFWMLRLVVQILMSTINNLLVRLPFVQPIPFFYLDHTQGLAIFLLILLTASPWLIDALLKYTHGLQPLSITQLSSHSPETAQMMQNLSRQKRIALPTIGILPSHTPTIPT